MSNITDLPSQLEDLSDNELIASAHRVYMKSRELTVRLLRHLILIEERRLDLKAACTSLYDFCVRKLRMSGSTAFRHATAARLAAKYPQILDRLATNRLHMTTLVLMRHFLMDETVDALLDLVEGKSRDEVEELLANIAPSPDAPERMRKIAEHGVFGPAHRDQLKPMGDARYRVEFTADRDLRDDINEARDLMRHTNPSGELMPVFKYCVRAGLDRLRSRRMGPRKARPRTRDVDRPRLSETIDFPEPVRRAVFERDGERCTFHSEEGERCPSTTLLELDHIKPRAKGGTDEVHNLRVRCRAHNRLYAEQVFGKALIAARIARARKQTANGSGASS